MRKTLYLCSSLIFAFLSFVSTANGKEAKCEIIDNLYSDTFVLIEKKPLTLGIIVKGSYTIKHKDGTEDGPHEGKKDEPHKGFLGMMKVTINNFIYENITEKEINAAQSAGIEQFKKVKLMESCEKNKCNNTENN